MCVCVCVCVCVCACVRVCACGNCYPLILCSNVLPFPPLFSPPVLAELQQVGLITSVECEGLSDIRDVVNVQKGKSPEVIPKTAEVLRRHGFDEESRLLAGRQSRPSSICLCYVVQWSLLMTATL